MKISVRRFEISDIPNKIEWINNPENNKYLHYELPLEYEKTLRWFESASKREDRYDGVIEADGTPVGLIGLLSIDRAVGKAEMYITLGDARYKGRGVAREGLRLLLDYAFGELRLNRVYCYTEVENIAARRLYERVGFRREGTLYSDVLSHGTPADRAVYGLLRADYLAGKRPLAQAPTPIQHLGEVGGNELYMKRDDLIPVSFGGNKARKARLFFEDMPEGTDAVVTYGSASSNHCRVVANMAAARGMECRIISPEETAKESFNGRMMTLFGAKITVCPVARVKETIDEVLSALRTEGRTPYFIQGGGHGNIGTRAYAECYAEIAEYERECATHFDYIVHASGTGTTQAGLVAGKLMSGDEREIVGVSIARRAPYGREVVVKSVADYLAEVGCGCAAEEIDAAVDFDDSFVGEGYGSADERVRATIRGFMTKYGIPLDETYTGKALAGALELLGRRGVRGKRVLFIHTGGTPLYFDYLMGLR